MQPCLNSIDLPAHSNINARDHDPHDRIRTTTQCLDHRRVRSLFDEMSRTSGENFAVVCRSYTTLAAELIFEDRKCVAALDWDPVTLGQFYEWEREIDELAHQHGQTLHRLEMKYTSPHCI